MVELRTKTRREDGVTFVAVVVTNSRRTAQRIRLESQLDGPMWPPTEGRRPLPAWDGDRWEARLPAGSSRGIGFASPAPPADPPMELVDIERADSEEETHDEVIASLDEWTPPADVLGGKR